MSSLLPTLAPAFALAIAIALPTQGALAQEASPEFVLPGIGGTPSEVVPEDQGRLLQRASPQGGAFGATPAGKDGAPFICPRVVS